MSKCFPWHDIFGQGQAAMIVSNYQCFCPATYDALCKAGLKQRLLDIATWTHIRPLWKIAAFGKDHTHWWLKNIGIFHRWSSLTSFQLGRHQHHLWHKWYYIDIFTYIYGISYGLWQMCGIQSFNDGQSNANEVAQWLRSFFCTGEFGCINPERVGAIMPARVSWWMCKTSTTLTDHLQIL